MAAVKVLYGGLAREHSGGRPGAGQWVITTSLTFCATVNAILHAGLRPVLTVVDRVTQNIDPGAIE
ncbi:DegT/DnrJ/EryC1/StrS family aminotransferase [Dyella sp. Tek66A03]|uniref:DegT/DnrJ/EryC1/StrS family aminotransferase n=1 Tax=Dyella sp. Tek66A03 TaxID=3458298 RepID=UPI00403E76A6